MSEPEFDVVLYGATGYTGRLVAHDLDDQDASFAIAGRSPERLEKVADELESDPETIVASVDDEEALASMAERARTVASAAGPFQKLGPPVLDAALDAGAHFVDTTGEQGYLRWAYEERDERAREAGLTVVNACGFDVIPSDLSAYLAADAVGDPVSVDIALMTNSRLSDGTKRTMAATTGDWWEYEDGEFSDAVPGRYLRSFDYPDRDEPRSGVFIPWGDVATAPRSTGADNVRTFFVLPSKQARRYNLFWPVQALVSKIPGIEKLLESQAPDSRGGPSDEDRERSWFKIIAEAEGRDGKQARALVSGKDPYGLTGAATSRIAAALARGEGEDAGVLTSTQAFGPERIQKMLPDFELEGRILEE